MFNNRKQRNCYLACFLAVRSVKNIKIEKKKEKNGVLSFVFFLLFLAFLRIRHSIFSIENATSAFPMTVSLHGAWMQSSSPWVFWEGNL